MRNNRIYTLLVTCCGLLLASFAVNAKSAVNQLLDSTFVHGQDRAAELVFDDPASDYEYLGINGTALQACKLTAFNGLYCLDGKIVRNWPHPSTQVDLGGTPGVTSETVVDCEDPVLNLDNKKNNTCTGMTVDLEGNLWLAGKNKGRSHSLMKLSANNGGCPSGWAETDTGLCAVEFATGRPLLVDLVAVDGVFAEGFSLPNHAAPLKAILGLEERKTAVAFLADGTVLELASGKADWGLAGNEQLLSLTVLQLDDPLQNYILVTTTNGRVLAWDTTGGEAAVDVFNMRDKTNFGLPSSFDDGPCSIGDAVYSVRASSTTNLVYVTDSEYCEVSALQASRDGDGKLTLALASGMQSTFSTGGLTAVTGVTVAPGNTIDLSTCFDPNAPCALVVDSNGEAAATMGGVKLVDTAISGLTLFQVEGMPDCRYVPIDCLPLIPPVDPMPTTPAGAVSALISAGVIVPLNLNEVGSRDTTTNPGAQRLNITPLLPEEITDLFTTELPDMLLPRYVRGQSGNLFVFGGFFGVTENGVVFRDTFEGRYDVAALAGLERGCEENLGSLDWDIVGTVSERWLSAKDPYSMDGPLHLMSIINSGCGSSRTRDTNWSFKPYNLELAPCTFNPDETGIWSDDGTCALPGTGATDDEDDAVYAKLLLVMADDYVRMLDVFACADGDGNGVAPLDAAGCLLVSDQVDNMNDKLHKCWLAILEPKQSAGDQNCQAFDSQLSNLLDLLELTPPVGPDRANRVGELKARAMTMREVFDSRFIPALMQQPGTYFVEP